MMLLCMFQAQARDICQCRINVRTAQIKMNLTSNLLSRGEYFFRNMRILSLTKLGLCNTESVLLLGAVYTERESCFYVAHPGAIVRVAFLSLEVCSQSILMKASKRWCRCQISLSPLRRMIAMRRAQVEAERHEPHS